MEFTVPTIETERLILRPLTIDDAEAAFEWTGDERVAKYMIYSTHESIETTKEWLNAINVSSELYEWGFVRKSDNKLIGAGSMRYRTDEKKWSFGYNMRYDCWNMGYTTEATLAMMNYVRFIKNLRVGLSPNTKLCNWHWKQYLNALNVQI